MSALINHCNVKAAFLQLAPLSELTEPPINKPSSSGSVVLSSASLAAATFKANLLYNIRYWNAFLNLFLPILRMCSFAVALRNSSENRRTIGTGWPRSRRIESTSFTRMCSGAGTDASATCSSGVAASLSTGASEVVSLTRTPASVSTWCCYCKILVCL